MNKSFFILVVMSILITTAASSISVMGSSLGTVAIKFNGNNSIEFVNLSIMYSGIHGFSGSYVGKIGLSNRGLDS